MTLPEQLYSGEDVTREYEIGDFGYWNAGPDLAIFYDDIYEQTIVEVVPLGHADKGAKHWQTKRAWCGWSWWRMQRASGSKWTLQYSMTCILHNKAGLPTRSRF